MKNQCQKWVFLIKIKSDKISVEKTGLEKSVFKHRSSLSKIKVFTGSVENGWMRWQFLNAL